MIFLICFYNETSSKKVTWNMWRKLYIKEKAKIVNKIFRGTKVSRIFERNISLNDKNYGERTCVVLKCNSAFEVITYIICLRYDLTWYNTVVGKQNLY